ncbi:MAG: hypothetical protein KJ702_04450 [Gammaproteobacteria bacterium]|nr:hypothetical protein [Gammaproteobacteria bacterium]
MLPNDGRGDSKSPRSKSSQRYARQRTVSVSIPVDPVVTDKYPLGSTAKQINMSAMNIQK